MAVLKAIYNIQILNMTRHVICSLGTNAIMIGVGTLGILNTSPHGLVMLVNKIRQGPC